MTIKCVWEHNKDDTLLYAADFPGAYTRGSDLTSAKQKMHDEIFSYLKWIGVTAPSDLTVKIIQDYSCSVQVCDADSDVLFVTEKKPLTVCEYSRLKSLALKSAADFMLLYESVPDKNKSILPIRNTFYGKTPRTANEMYEHTKNVNRYYFGEIGIDTENNGTILECRVRGFSSLEASPNWLSNSKYQGSYDEEWTLRKLLRRFIWHDRIHAKAMYRMAIKTFGSESIPNIFCF